MTALEVFAFPATGQEIRTVVRDGEPWFVGRDACDLLALADLQSSLRLLDDDEKGRHSVPTPGGDQQMTVISESGLYSLILRSRRPEAKAFKRWITHDVLPALRQTGRYEVDRLGDPLDEIELANSRTSRAVQIARQERAARIVAETRALELEPSAQAWDVLASAHGDYSVREAAFILNRDPAIDTGQKRLFQLLRDWKLIDSRDKPYAAHARHVCLRARSYQSPRTGEERATEQVRITVDGLRYLHGRLGGTSPFTHLALAEDVA
ncbi:MAG: phage antirepressor protein [Streptosporangiaceae bacterium]|nr:phage antirepressor protein [Streptosporangiaceae bacterium]